MPLTDDTDHDQALTPVSTLQAVSSDAISALELAIVIPTFKERQNVVPLLRKLSAHLRDFEYEVIFVDDDSPDGTADLIREIAISNPRVHVLQRFRRRGLASACVEGMMASAAPFIAVMDADLQHDETILATMLELLRSGRFDLALGTRNADGGSMGDFSKKRVRISNLGRFLSNLVSETEVSDPMSGFFMVTRGFLSEVAPFVSGIGFKILLDILASANRPVAVAEVPYRFGERVHGESKLDIVVALEYLQLLLDKSVGRFLPVRFLIFGMVGALGAAVHLIVLYLGLTFARLSFPQSQAVATAIVMTLNFFLNNAITYRDRRLRGAALIGGLLTFYAACAVGAFVNIRVASFAVDAGARWYIAGLFGIVLSSVWNYAVTAVFTWRQERASLHRREHTPAAR
jgi:dolichol-phosphate mannosyltransferase